MPAATSRLSRSRAADLLRGSAGWISRTAIVRHGFTRIIDPWPRPRARSGLMTAATDSLLRRVRLPRAYRHRSAACLVDMFFDLVDAVGVERFVEAGAKEASASHRAAGLAGIVRVVAFEANPFTHRRFADDAATAGVDYRHLALDRAAGTTRFYVRLSEHGRPRADGQGSLHRRLDYGPGHAEVEVATTSLDGFFADETPRGTALWVDVEGAASNVFSGATQLLATTDVVLVEVEERALWAPDQWLANDVVSFLARFDLVPVGRDAQADVQYNLLFVRRRLLDDARLATARGSWRRCLAAPADRPVR